MTRTRRPGLLRAALAVTALSTLALAAPTAAPADAPVGPQQAHAASVHRQVSGWIPYWDNTGGYNDAIAHANLLHTVSPFWYEATGYDTIKGQTGAGNTAIINGLHAKGIKVVPTVTETMSATAMASVLNNTTYRRAHVAALMKVVKSRSYDGLDLDYETMTMAGAATADRVRTGFDLLVTDLCSALHAARKQCVITVMPRTTDAKVYWRTKFATWEYDYAHIGRYADRMRIMGYHMHGPNETPGPMSTPAWYDQIAAYAVTRASAAKIELALPAYGYDWVNGKAGTGVSRTWRAAEALRRSDGATRYYNTTWAAPYFYYWANGVKRVVVYENSQGTGARVDVIKKYHLAGTGLWAIDFEDPHVWNVLAATYTY